MTDSNEAANDFIRLRAWGARAELCSDGEHDIVVTVPSLATGIKRIVGYLSFEEWKAFGSNDERMHHVVLMVRAWRVSRGESAT